MVCYLFDSLLIVFRVHWLRARAQRGRWAEELVLVQQEMIWTVNFYMHMADIWNGRRDPPGRHWDPASHAARGHRAYAERQMSIWNNLGKCSELAFKAAYSEFECTWAAVV